MMSLLRRRRDLGLRPVSELHDEFMQRPDAEDLLAEAEEYWQQQEQEYAAQVEMERTRSENALVVDHDDLDVPVSGAQSGQNCGARTADGKQCANPVTSSTSRCAAGHKPRS